MTVSRNRARHASWALIVGAVASWLALGQSASADGSKETPRVAYWYVSADGDGKTYQEKCTFDGFVEAQFSPPAPAMWLDKVRGEADAVRLLVLPVGWQGSWHKNPQPQWIVPLSGRWYVETMDGTRVDMGPGDLSFGGDQAAKPDPDGRVGHRSGTVGDTPAVLMIVQLSEPPQGGSRCPF